MKTVKIANNEGNKSHLNNIGISFNENGRYLVVTPYSHHQAYLNSGQMSVASYKKNVLGL